MAKDERISKAWVDLGKLLCIPKGGFCYGYNLGGVLQHKIRRKKEGREREKVTCCGHVQQGSMENTFSSLGCQTIQLPFDTGEEQFLGKSVGEEVGDERSRDEAVIREYSRNNKRKNKELEQGFGKGVGNLRKREIATRTPVVSGKSKETRIKKS